MYWGDRISSMDVPGRANRMWLIPALSTHTHTLSQDMQHTHTGRKRSPVSAHDEARRLRLFQLVQHTHVVEVTLQDVRVCTHTHSQLAKRTQSYTLAHTHSASTPRMT